jgi:hypothetical protein
VPVWMTTIISASSSGSPQLSQTGSSWVLIPASSAGAARSYSGLRCAQAIQTPAS